VEYGAIERRCCESLVEESETASGMLNVNAEKGNVLDNIIVECTPIDARQARSNLIGSEEGKLVGGV